MALIITQGRQDTTQDNKFEPIVEKDVLCQITELKLAKSMANTLEVTLRILQGTHKNRFVFDRVMYQPSETYDGTWKYRSLRKCAGVPYDEKEPLNIDIEKLLLNKAVLVDLGVRVGKNKDGEDTNYQNVTYKMRKVEPNIDAEELHIEAPTQEVQPDKPVKKVTARKTKATQAPAPEPEQAPLSGIRSGSIELDEEGESANKAPVITEEDYDDWEE